MKYKLRLFMFALLFVVSGLLGYSSKAEANTCKVSFYYADSKGNVGDLIFEKDYTVSGGAVTIKSSNVTLPGWEKIKDGNDMYLQRYVKPREEEGKKLLFSKDYGVHGVSTAIDTLSLDASLDKVKVYCYNLSKVEEFLSVDIYLQSYTGVYERSHADMTSIGEHSRNIRFNSKEDFVSKRNTLVSSEICTGYTFKGWSCEDGSNNLGNNPTYGDLYETFFDSFSVHNLNEVDNPNFIDNIGTQNLRLVANFEINTYPIEYNLNGGINNLSNKTSYTVKDSFNIYSPIRKGYKFDGWYETSDFSGTPFVSNVNREVYANGNPIARKLTLNAKWSKIPYTISYELNGGELKSGVSLVQSYDVETEISSIPSPTKEGYTFEGWYSSKNLTGDVVSSIPKGSIGNRNLYAKFSPIEYNIEYYLNDGTNHESQPTTHNAVYKTWLLDPTREDYTFDGWYYSEDFSGDKILGIEKGLAKDVKVYAKWVSNADIEAKKQAELDAIEAAKREKEQAEYDAKEEKTVPVTENDYTEKDIVNSVEVKGYKTQESVDKTNEMIESAKSNKVKFVTAKNKKKTKAVISWKTSKGYSYEVQYSTSSKFKKSATKLKDTSKGSITLSKLIKGNKYYVRVRSYKVINDEKIYGNWSVTKTVRIKK